MQHVLLAGTTEHRLERPTLGRKVLGGRALPRPSSMSLIQGSRSRDPFSFNKLNFGGHYKSSVIKL